MKKAKIILIAFILSVNTFAYSYLPGDMYFGGGVGADVNVVRYDIITKKTPKAFMPVLLSFDYTIDSSLGFLTAFIPSFSSGAFGMALDLGVKWRFLNLDSPFSPYLSIGVSPSMITFTGVTKNHYSIGGFGGVGINYFVLSNLVVGLGLKFSPKYSFIDSDSKFELATMSFLEVMIKI